MVMLAKRHKNITIERFTQALTKSSSSVVLNSKTDLTNFEEITSIPYSFCESLLRGIIETAEKQHSV